MIDKNVRTLELYYLPTCPYCAKVRSFIEREGIKNIAEHDITNGEELKELLRINHGNRQVPCLVVNGEPMLESDDIIEFLAELKANKEADRAV